MTTNAGTILVVDDDASDRILLVTSLEEQGYIVEVAENGWQALEKLRAQPFDVVLLDLLMPKMDGFQVLERMKADSTLRHIPVIVTSAADEMESVVRCIEMGATDHLPKPLDPVLLYARINASLAAKRLYDQETEYLQNVARLTDAAAAVEVETFDPDSLSELAARSDALGQLARVFQRMAREVYARQQHLKHHVQEATKDRYKFGEIIGKSLAMQKIYEQIVRATTSDANVVITGESGTGKELVAQTIHQLSKRRKKTFVPVNCGAIPDYLFEREFFGHRKGAFTSADRDKPGLFDAAHGGTLFLDEVGELPATMQVKLLRVLQNGEYTPVGDNTLRQVDVRIIAATNKNLEEQREQGLIRDDFFYRLYVIVINLPPLRDRKEDIPLLVDHFLKRYDEGAMRPTIPAHIMEALLQYDWAGNIRELQNVLQRYLAGERLEFIDTRQTEPGKRDRTSDTEFGSEGLSLREIVEAYEKHVIARVLQQNHGHTGKAAAMLNIPLRTLYGKIQKYQLR
jgi:DNA-binding NtrC family response regulator